VKKNIIYHMLDYSLALALTRWINYKQEKSAMSSSIVFHNKGDDSPSLAFLEVVIVIVVCKWIEKKTISI
jgi:hypothetical protein